MKYFSNSDESIIVYLLAHGPTTAQSLSRSLNISPNGVYKSLKKLMNMDIIVKVESSFLLHPYLDCSEPYEQLGSFILDMLMGFSEKEYERYESDNPPLYHVLAVLLVALNRISKEVVSNKENPL